MKLELNEVPPMRDCCASYLDTENHDPECPFIQSIDESYKQDADRHTDGLTNHSATALHKKVLIASNGHSVWPMLDRG